MTIYEMGILMHYHCRCIDHEDLDRQPPVWKPTIEDFLRRGLLIGISGGNMRYNITERGRVYVKALERVPLPEPSWTIRWPEPETELA